MSKPRMNTVSTFSMVCRDWSKLLSHMAVSKLKKKWARVGDRVLDCCSALVLISESMVSRNTNVGSAGDCFAHSYSSSEELSFDTDGEGSPANFLRRTSDAWQGYSLQQFNLTLFIE
jgi:hypothetical protein